MDEALRQRARKEHKLLIELRCNPPPKPVKWNKIEHRLFCPIARDWQGVSLKSHETVVNFIGPMKTKKGLEIRTGFGKNQLRKIEEDQWWPIYRSTNINATHFMAKGIAK